MNTSSLFSIIIISFLLHYHCNCQNAPKAGQISSISKPKEGGVATFACATESGDKPIHFKWFKDAQPIENSETIRIESLTRDSSILIIDPITVKHNGNYTCVLSNNFGKDSSSIQISIESPPRWKNKPSQSYKVRSNSAFNVSCSGEGFPQTRSEWKKFTGTSWEPLNHDLIKTTQSEMNIVKSTKLLSGRYGCEVSNGIEPKLWSEFEIFITDIKAKIGQTIELDCIASGFPKPEIVWKKFTDDMWTNINYLQNVQISNDHLIINSIDRLHGGSYGCSAANKIEPNLWTEFVIMVEVFPAKFKEKKTYVSTKRDTSLELECSAEGDKPLTIKWSKDSVLLNKSGYQRYTITDSPTTDGLKSVLTVRSADLVDDGSYLCVAENEFGKDERNIRVTIIEAPPAPQNLQIRQTWSRSVSLNWAPPASNALPILGYIVRYWKITGQGQNERLREINVSLPMNSVLINALEPSCLYEAEIIAVNEVGPGQPSRTIKFETGEEEPTGAPIDLQAIARGPTTIRVSWKPPTKDKWNGKILGYYVGYRRAGDFKSPHSFKTVDAASHNNTYEYLITSLVKGTAYSITIKAYNSAGNGPEHQEIIVETLLGNVPPAPRFKVLSATSDSLNLRYNIVPDSAPVQLLQLHFKELSDLDWSELALTYEGKDSNEYTLTNLNPSTVYKLYVTASNEHGISDPSQMITAKTARSLNDLSSISGPFDSTSLLGPGSSSFGEMVYFPAITISIASIIIVIVIAFVFVKKARLDASAKSNFEFCQASQTGILAHNRATGTTFGTVQRFVDHDKTMSLVTTGPCDDAYNGQLPTPYSKIPIGTEKRNSTLTDNRHFYDYPQ